jgi:hypothetical protein
MLYWVAVWRIDAALRVGPNFKKIVWFCLFCVYLSTHTLGALQEIQKAELCPERRKYFIEQTEVARRVTYCPVEHAQFSLIQNLIG